MNIYKKKLQGLERLFEENRFLERIIFIAVIITALSCIAPGQTTRDETALYKANGEGGKMDGGSGGRSNSLAGQPAAVPLADHHTHIWSLTASALVTEPMMPAVELPEELKRLLQDKERFGGRDKNPSALTDLYTKDLLVMNPG